MRMSEEEFQRRLSIVINEQYDFKPAGLKKKTRMLKKQFCEYYVASTNMTDTAERVGVNKDTCYEWLKDPAVLGYIDFLNKVLTADTIASATEVKEYLTSVMRGQIKDYDTVQVKDDVTGEWRPVVVEKPVSVKERNKSAELLGKTMMLYSEKLQVDANAVVVIEGEGELLD